MPPSGPVNTWTESEKVEEALRRSTQHMPGDLARQVDALLTGENLAILVGTLVIWAGSHFVGVGEIVDVGLLLVGVFTVGWSIGNIAEDLLEFGLTAIRANTQADLDRAARAFARATVAAGITTIMALLLRRGAKQLQAARPGASALQLARPQNPGIGTVGADSQAGRLWRRPTTTLDPARAAGTGETSWFGDMTLSSAGSATEQQLVRTHEIVHSLLKPRLSLLRTFRARVAASAYWRSAFMRYLEEGLAETIAQLRVNGLIHIFTGIRFPIANGYVTIQSLVCEGTAIGTIAVLEFLHFFKRRQPEPSPARRLQRQKARANSVVGPSPYAEA